MPANWIFWIAFNLFVLLMLAITFTPMPTLRQSPPPVVSRDDPNWWWQFDFEAAWRECMDALGHRR